MPAPLRVDWNKIKLLYLAGNTLADVAQQCGVPYATVRQKAFRHKWKEESPEFLIPTKTARSVATAVATEAKRDMRDMMRQSNAWKERIIKLTERHLSSVEAKSDNDVTLDDLERLVRITHSTDTIARRSLGLDIQQSDSHVTLHLGDLTPGRPAPKQLQSESTEVIDIEIQPQDTKEK